MNPITFADWLAAMKEARGWSGRRCAAELGCGINQITRWADREGKGPPRYIGLACAALARDIPAWGKAPGPPQVLVAE